MRRSTVLKLALPAALVLGLYAVWSADGPTARKGFAKGLPAAAAAIAAHSDGADPPKDARTAVSLRTTETIAAASKAIGRLAARLNEDLLNAPEYKRYTECAARQADPKACKELLSDALYAATSRSLDPFCADEAKRVHCRDADTRMQLQTAAALAPDPTTRMAAIRLLALVCPDPRERAFPLADSVYEGLPERTGAEAHLLLTVHSRAPLETDVQRRAVAALAMNPETAIEVRAAALVALSHTSEDAEYLDDLVQAYLEQTDNSARPLLPRRALARALGGCGTYCRATLRQMAAEPGAPSDLAFEALRYFTDGSARSRVEAELAELRSGRSAAAQNATSTPRKEHQP